MTDEDKSVPLSIEKRIVKVKELIAKAEAKGGGDLANKLAVLSFKSHLNDLYEIRDKKGEHE